MTIIKISAKEMNEKYIGARGGYITGAHYGLYEEGQGYVSLDSKRAYLLPGKTGKAAMQSIIDAGGFCGAIAFVETI